MTTESTLVAASSAKETGNAAFKNGMYLEAAAAYTKCLKHITDAKVCRPPSLRAILHPYATVGGPAAGDVQLRAEQSLGGPA